MYSFGRFFEPTRTRPTDCPLPLATTRSADRPAAADALPIARLFLAPARLAARFPLASSPARQLASSPSCPFARYQLARLPDCPFARLPTRPLARLLVCLPPCSSVCRLACRYVRLLAVSPVYRLARRPVRQFACPSVCPPASPAHSPVRPFTRPPPQRSCAPVCPSARPPCRARHARRHPYPSRAAACLQSDRPHQGAALPGTATRPPTPCLPAAQHPAPANRHCLPTRRLCHVIASSTWVPTVPRSAHYTNCSKQSCAGMAQGG